MATAGAPSAKNAPSHMEAGTTWYYNGADSQGLSYEKTILANGTTEHKHYVNAGGVTFALYVQREGNLNGKPATSTSYFHHDHLGSIAAVSNAAGVVVERMAYDPWGKRRFSNGTNDRLDALYGVSTDRGYTMHEHLDEMGIIHMNGRVYDPLNGRFMSSDPIIQEPGNLQSYNRYAYVFNNPLLFTDPSGYSAWTKFRDRVLKPVAFAYIGYLTGGLAMNAIIPSSMGVAGGGLLAVGGAVGGFTAGALSTGTFKGAVQGAFTGALFGAAGSVGIADSGARYLAHAGAGCVSAVAGGGNCGQGAASAVFGKFTSNNINIQNDLGRGIAVAVAGGIGSVIGGGKFENGAETAAFGYLFNQLMSTEEANRRAALRNGQVMQGVGCVAEAASRCAGLPVTNGGSPEQGVDVLKLGVQMTAPGRVAVTVYDVATVGLDLANEKYKDAGLTTGSLAFGAAVEKGLTRIGLPAPVAGRWGATAGSVYDQLVKPFKN